MSGCSVSTQDVACEAPATTKSLEEIQLFAFVKYIYLALGIVSLEDGDNLREQGDKVGSLDVAVLLQLGDEAHERGGVGRVLGAQLLELGAEEGKSELAGPELQCGRVAHQDFQLVQKMWRRHCSGQRSHLDISISTSESNRNSVSMIRVAID